MGVVLIRASPVSSHYNATFKIANTLKTKYGHRIIYLGDDNFGEAVRANGFEYENVHHTYYGKIPQMGSESQMSPVGNRTKRFLSHILRSFLALLRSRQMNILFESMKMNNLPLLATRIKALKPDLVFIDTFYYYEFPMLYSNDIPFAVYQTKFSTNKEKNIPPLTSKFTPSDTKFSTLYTEFLWLNYSLQTRIKKMKDYIFLAGNSPSATFRQIVKKFSFPNKFLYTNRTFNAGFTNTWEFVLSSAHFDLERNRAPFQIQMGPVVNIDRNETDYDYRFLSFKQADFFRKNRADRHILFCSLGSIANVHSKHCKRFYERLISVVQRNKKFLLIISIGFLYEINDFIVTGDNVFIFQKVPQTEVLQYCDLMITHGGMQSITECVLCGVPMIVYPLNDKWDQNGNSTRVLYHKVGLRGNIRRDTEKKIESLITKITTTTIFKENALQLGARMREGKDFTKGIDFLNLLVNSHKIPDGQSEKYADV